MKDHSGTRFDRYEILERIGAGGQAQVYKARQDGTGQFVAVKILDPSFVSDPHIDKRFRCDMEALADLRHSYIVPLIDYLEDPSGLRLLVMSHIDGGTLADRIKADAPLPVEEVATIVNHVGEALAYAHKKGILHRDVKPANLLVDEHGKCLLTDFGIAKRAGDELGLTEAGKSVGSALYMSPEQGHGEPLDARSDLYSLACIVFELLTGERAFQGKSFVEVVLQKQKGPPTFSKACKVPAELQAIVLKALATKRDDRQATVAAFATEFVTTAKRATVGFEDTTAITDTHAVRRTGGFPLGKVAGLLLMVGAIAGIGLGTDLFGKSPEETVGPGDGPFSEGEKAFQAPKLLLPLPPEPEVPAPSDHGPWSPKIDVLLVLEEELGGSRWGMGRVARAAVLGPIAEELREVENIDDVHLPPIFAPIAGPTGSGVPTEFLGLEPDIAVVVGYERVPSADIEKQGPRLSERTVQPAVRLRAALVERGGGTLREVTNPKPVVAAAENSGRSVDDGLPSAIESAAPEIVAGVIAELEAYVKKRAEEGVVLRIGIVAPHDEDGIVTWFARVVKGAPGLTGPPEDLPPSDWTFERDGRWFVRTSAAEPNAGDTIVIESDDVTRFWALTQKAHEAVTLEYLEGALETWIVHTSKVETIREQNEDLQRAADPATAEADRHSPTFSAPDFVDLRLRWRVVVGDDMIVFHIWRPALPADDARDDGGGTDFGSSGKSRSGAGGVSSINAHMGRMASSVYLPIAQTKGNGLELGLGSAWVVGDDGVLATNAHVAELMDAKKFGETYSGLELERVVVRRASANNVVEFEVDRFELHPGYNKMLAKGAKTMALRPGTLEPAIVDYSETCDVALVYLKPNSDGGFNELGEPFELATTEELHHLERGLEVAYLGFPAEASSNMVSVDRPTPISIRGSMTGAVDASMGSSEADFARLLRVDLPLVGGASGSVLLRADGKVVGVVSSNAVIKAGDQATLGASRIALSGFGYAQRADTLRELIEGTASEALARQEQHWEELFERDLAKFSAWIQETFVHGFPLDEGRSVTGASLLSRKLIVCPTFPDLPDNAKLYSKVQGVDFELGVGESALAITIHTPHLPSAARYYEHNGASVYASDGPISGYAWQSGRAIDASVRGFYLLPKQLVGKGVDPGPQLMQVFLYRLN